VREAENEAIQVQDTTRYRPNVVAIVINKEGKVLCGERSDFADQSFWQCPQGGIDPNEDAVEAAKREVEEELGLPAHSLKVLPPSFQIKEMKFRYTFQKPVLKDGKLWDGQEQQVVLFMYDGDGNLDKCQLTSGKEPEFKRVEWKLLSDIVPYVLPSKQQIYKTLSYLLPETLNACTTQPLWQMVGLNIN
jgi:putative (di)nucleoside polyphosphate hydrolase